ncbi:hypothetical protein ABT158_50135 [Nonomuraea sp. NPDC001636]|uniref:hypothetical protein n=1 Tax=Nonomuraea sp. NPDC001636 TaxID=3154391 RepID=UPI00333338CF
MSTFTGGRPAATLLTALTALAAVALLPPAPAAARPVQATMPVSVLMCTFTNRLDEPKDRQFFKDLLTTEGAGKGGLADYVTEQSGGRVSIEGSEVYGWYTIPKTFEEWYGWGMPNPTKKNDCLKAAESQGYRHPAGRPLLVVVNGPRGGSSGPREYFDRSAILDTTGWTLDRAVNVVFGLYGLTPGVSRIADGASADSGNRWDAMSVSGTFFPPSERFGQGAIGLAAPRLDELGWLPYWRVVTLGKDGAATQTVRLAPLEQPDRPGTLMVRVPNDQTTPGRYLTVEFRKRTGRSAAIPADTLLIHDFKPVADWPGMHTSTLLVDQRDADGRPIQSYDQDGVRIRLDSMTEDAATVTVTTDLTTKCRFGFVPRNAIAGDDVCVTAAARDQAADDNANQNGRHEGDGSCRTSAPLHRALLPPPAGSLTPEVHLRPVRGGNRVAGS